MFALLSTLIVAVDGVAGRILDYPGYSGTDYQLPNLRSCNGTSSNQQWAVSGVQLHEAATSNPGCLACFLENCAKDDLLHVDTCDSSSTAQQFVLVSTGAGFLIQQRSSSSGQCLTADSLSVGSLVRMMPCEDTTPGQVWMLDPTAQHGLVSVGDLCLDRTAQFYEKFPCADSGLPSGYACGCLPGGAAHGLPFCNADLSVAARVKDLISRLSLSEKQGLMGPDLVHTSVNDCAGMDGGVVRLGIPPYMHLTETNSAVSTDCIAANKCASEFPAPACLAASFNRSLWKHKGAILGTEMRALSNAHAHRSNSDRAFVGQTGFGPNINIVRDPRFGRNSELPSECPFLAGSYASEMLQGMQIGPDPKYLQMIAGVKHYTAYSVEDHRETRIFNVSTFDLFDTYLEQYRMAFSPQHGNAMALMCAYSGVNGVPMCANDYLLNKVIRGRWNRSEVFVATDCGAINNMLHFNKYTANAAEAAAATLNGGTDLDLGDPYFPPGYNGGNNALKNAIDDQLTSEATVDAALARTLALRFRVGQFDPVEQQPYTQIGVDAVNSTESWEFVLDSALQGLVLLRNDGGVLPLAATGEIAVVGPHVASRRDLFEDYMGDQLCGDGTNKCIETVGNAFQKLHEGVVHVEAGVEIDSENASGIPAALAAVDKSQQVVLLLGIGNVQEHEGVDRSSTMLPGLQLAFARQVLARGKPTAVVLINGGILSVEDLEASALIEAFYPGYRTGDALYQALCGRANRWGKLPVTIYKNDFAEQMDMYDFSMTAGMGRTYRYFNGAPLYPFGYGLSYSSFSFACSLAAASDTSFQKALTFLVSCELRNEGLMDGDEVMMVFHSVGDDIAREAGHPIPLRRLIEFERRTLAAGAAAISVRFDIPVASLTLTDLEGNKVLYAGRHYLSVTNGVAPGAELPIDIPGTIATDIAPGGDIAFLV